MRNIVISLALGAGAIFGYHWCGCRAANKRASRCCPITASKMFVPLLPHSWRSTRDLWE